MALAMTLTGSERAQRKTLLTVAAWKPSATGTEVKELLGVRTEESSIEFNPDVATSTDILGITYTDVNKTEPQQSFDPFYIRGDSVLGQYLVEAALENNIAAYNGKFDIYIITAFISETKTEGSGDSAVTITAYKTVKHTGCSIIPTSMGGDSYLSMPIDVYYSNDITVGTVDKLDATFTFTADATT